MQEDKDGRTALDLAALSCSILSQHVIDVFRQGYIFQGSKSQTNSIIIIVIV